MNIYDLYFKLLLIIFSSHSLTSMRSLVVNFVECTNIYIKVIQLEILKCL